MVNKNVLILLAVLLFPLIASAREIRCSDNPMFVFHFNENQSNSTYDSCSGIQGNFTDVLGDVNSSDIWTAGKYGSAVKFNGLSDYLDMGTVPQLQSTFDDYSMTAWYKYNGANAYNGAQRILQLGVYGSELDLTKMDSPYDCVSFSAWGVGTTTICDMSIVDGDWHFIAGTFQGSTQNMSVYLDGNYVGSTDTILPIVSSYGQDTVGSSDYDFSILNATVDELAFFNRTLSQDEITDYYNTQCDIQYYNMTIFLPSTYPYFQPNGSYTLGAIIDGGNYSYIYTDVIINNTADSFHWDNLNNVTLIFPDEFLGQDIPFTIYTNEFCSRTQNFSGVFKIREPFNLKVEGFLNKNNRSYINNFAYVTAEPKSKPYDKILEPYLMTLPSYVRNPSFHAPYINGEADIQLWEKNTTYTLRLIDGIMNFPSMFSTPNISRSYGTNILIGDVYLTGDSTTTVYITQKDLHPYTWLINWIFLFAIVFAVLLAFALLFMIPQFPWLSIGCGFFLVGSLLMLRIFMWVMVG